MTDEQLRSHVDPVIRERGEAYFREGRVRKIQRSARGVSATVAGSHEYDVSLTFDARTVFAQCTCPYFDREMEACKHIWAAVLAANARRFLPGELDELLCAGASGEHTEGVVVTMRPHAARVPPKPAWQAFFEALPFEPVPRPRPVRVPDEIAYVVTGRSLVADSIRLDLVSRSRRKNGEWGRWAPLRLDTELLDQLPQFDQETIGLLHGENLGWGIASTRTVAGGVAAWWIERIARAGSLRVDREGDLVQIAWDEGGAWTFAVSVGRDEARSAYRVDGALRRGAETLPLSEVLFTAPGVLVTAHFAAPLVGSGASGWISPLRRHAPVEVPFEARERFREALLRSSPPGIEVPDELRLEVVHVTPLPLLALGSDGSGTDFDAELRFVYGDRVITAQSPRAQWLEGTTVIRRDAAAERRHRSRLEATRVVASYSGHRLRLAYLEEVLRELTAEGWHIEIEGKSLRSADRFDLEISSGIDWFELDASASFGGQSVALPDLLAAAAARKSILPLADGSFALVPQQWAEGLAPLVDLGQQKGAAYRFVRHQALLIDAMLEARAAKADREFIDLRDRVRGPAAGPAGEPATFHGTLRPYQREGLGWMLHLRETGMGGCLADDMGLGKTVQVLALLERMRVEGRGPSLVVAPRSLLFNWAAEAARFAPQLRVVEHHGAARPRDGKSFGDCDLVLTTYATMRLDVAHFAGTEFEYAILDEAQSIKNAGSQVAKAAGLLRARHRLALSGTPIENHLGELWSLFHFLDPGLLGSARHFNRAFSARSVPQERREILARALRPLILRRTKEQVAPELPERIEQTLWCELEGDQRRQYDELRDHYRRAILGRVAREGVAKSRMQVLEALLRLRQVACHPALVDSRFEGTSAKLDVLLAEIEEVVESGHRALVFSQFTTFLDIVRRHLERNRREYLYLDGRTRDREAVVERFQSEGGPQLFLVSLKAGGLGLNLTNADYVFLLDPWWNPAVEAQAVDRAHRIGRRKPVVAYRVIARDTVEEKILELQSRKREIADSIISEDNAVLRGLEADDLALLLS